MRSSDAPGCSESPERPTCASSSPRRPSGPAAQLALDVYTHRLRKSIAAMTASLGGLDVLVFTGGVGERSPDVRGRAAAGLGYLGVALEAERNAAATGAEDCDISHTAATVRTVVVAAREDIEIARQARLATAD